MSIASNKPVDFGDAGRKESPGFAENPRLVQVVEFATVGAPRQDRTGTDASVRSGQSVVGLEAPASQPIRGQPSASQSMREMASRGAPEAAPS